MAERARSAAPDAEVIVGDATSLDVPDGSFEVIVSAFVVFFMPDPTAALMEWGRVLAPGGRLLLSTWASPDPRWSWERDLRREFIGDMDPSVARALGHDASFVSRFDDRSKVAHELELGGWAIDEQIEHQIEFVFADEQAWWDWNWSHASRMYLEALPEGARQRFRERAYEAMQAVRDERGLPRTYTAIFTRARRAD